MAVLGQGNYATPYTFTTLAGYQYLYGSWDGTGSAAQFFWPVGVAVDGAGNLYEADCGNNTIRKLTPVGTNWVVTTLAGLAGYFGDADGTGGAARFSLGGGGGSGGFVAVDSAGNLYVGDAGNNSIRKVTPVGANWVVTTLAGSAGNSGTNDGTGTDARFNNPWAVAVDSAANVYVADAGNNTIRKVTPAGVVTTLAGSTQFNPAGRLLYGGADGTGSAAQFNSPQGLAVDSAGNLYVGDDNNFTIRKVTPAGVVTTIAGSVWYGSADGTGGAARFNLAWGLAVDSAGNLYVPDSHNNTVRKVTPAGVVTTLAGLAGNYGYADGTGSAARFLYPRQAAVDSAGNVYVTDSDANTIRKVTPVGTYWVVTTLAGSAGHAGSADGTGTNALFNGPWGVAVDSAGNVYVAEYGNSTIREVTPAGVVTTLAGNWGFGADGTETNAWFDSPEGVAVDSAGNLYVADESNYSIRKGFPASSVPAPILQPPSLSAGQFGFGITGLPNLAVDLESSADLSQWQFVDTYVLVGGTNTFVSPNPPQGIQFYRGHVR